MYRKVELLFAASPIAIGLAAILGAHWTIALPRTAYSFDPVGPRGFAYVVGVMLVVLGVILLFTTVREQVAGGGLGARTDRDPPEAGDDMRHPASAWRAWGMMGLTLGFAVVVVTLGYILASMALIVGALLVMGIRDWRIMAIFPPVYALSTYLLFHSLLGVRLPAGPVEHLLAVFRL